MSANITYVATAHDGTVHTRSSKTMPYTHAILVRSDGTTGAYSWHKSYAAAVKATGTVDKRLAGRPGARCYVVEVTGYPYSSPEAKRARNGEAPEPVDAAPAAPVADDQLARTLFRAGRATGDRRRWDDLTDHERAPYLEAAAAGPGAPATDEPAADTAAPVADYNVIAADGTLEPRIDPELAARRHFNEHAPATELRRWEELTDAERAEHYAAAGFPIPAAAAEPELVVDAEIVDEPTHTLVVIPCAAAKSDTPAPAAELYTSSNFRHSLAGARAHAEHLQRTTGNPARVVILSALHGLLELDETVSPYDVLMGDERSITAQRLADQLELLQPEHISMMLPGKYRERLVAAVAIADPHNITIDDCYAGARGVGDQRAVASRMRRVGHADTLREAPAGTYVQGRGVEYRKSDRGDWATVSSTPDRYTSAELATILGQPEQPEPAPAPAPARKPSLVLRSIRVDDELWQAAQRKAKSNGDNVSEVLRAALQAYLEQ